MLPTKKKNTGLLIRGHWWGNFYDSPVGLNTWQGFLSIACAKTAVSNRQPAKQDLLVQSQKDGVSGQQDNWHTSHTKMGSQDDNMINSKKQTRKKKTKKKRYLYISVYT